jgi:cell division protein FtsZ
MHAMIGIDAETLGRADRMEPVDYRVVGIGGAGSNVLDRAVLDGCEQGRLIVVNTDVQSLSASVAPAKLQIGRDVTRGLGAGGDPGLGEEAALGSEPEIHALLEGVPLVFLVAGLGGGTGSGAVPVAARIAREAGAMVVAFVTVPFAFEGRRRCDQAAAALERMEAYCDAVVCFENDRMGEIVPARAGVHEAFAATDRVISQAIRVVGDIVRRPGLIRVGLDELLAALRNRSARCLFGFGEATGDSRVHDALAEALRSPLLDRGRLLGEASNLLVHVAGGPNLTLSEIEVALGELARQIPGETQVLLGLGVDPALGERVQVALLSSRPGKPAASAPAEIPADTAQPVKKSRRAPAPAPSPEPAAVDPGVEPEPMPATVPAAASSLPDPEPLIPRTVPPLAARPPRPVPMPVPAVAGTPTSEVRPAAVRQEEMQFEPVSRGRFEKSEPTLEDGQDLDVPTFLRKNMRVR